MLTAAVSAMLGIRSSYAEADRRHNDQIKHLWDIKNQRRKVFSYLSK